ncbi:hypothetical protein [Lujinxingia litoralis]|nr:hypothetical protein [Lujinxingia litoralis]
MTEGTSAHARVSGGRARAGALKWALLAFLMLNLWAQWLGAGLFAELRSADGSGLRILAMMVPLVVGVVGLVHAHPALRLLIFPVSFLPGMALLAEREWEAMSEPVALLMAVASFVLYLIVAAISGEEGELPAQQPADVHPGDGRAGDYRFFVRSRVLAVSAVLAAILGALYVSPAIKTSLVAQAAERAPLHLTFMAVVMLFAWVVMAYISAVLPALNWEYDRRQPVFSQSLARLMSSPRTLARRVMWRVVAAGAVIMVAFQTMR